MILPRRGTSMKHDLFISYSRVDSAFALRLVRDLAERGVETWFDQLDIPPGANWDNEIEKALDQAKIILVILSAVSAKSENVKNEIGAALERNKQVVPIVLAQGAVPLMITRLQREDFTGDYDAALDALPPHAPVPDELRRVAWMIEELRVSLFAQELGTAHTVSEKRIRKALKDALGAARA